MKPINPYPLRIDEELMDKLKRIADEHSRSVNKEIEFLIKEAVREYEDANNKDEEEIHN